MLNVDTECYATVSADTCDLVLAAPAKPSRWSIGGVMGGYDTAAAMGGGKLLVYNGSDTGGKIVWSVDMDENNRFAVVSPAEPVKFPPGRSVHVKLLNGGTIGKISILGKKLV